MAFESLSDKLGSVFKKLRNHGKLSEKDVKDAMREIKIALIEADVNFKTAKDFTAKVSERAVGSSVLDSLTPAQQVIDIVFEELKLLMGETNTHIDFAPVSKSPTVIMMCGLQGAGKTTHAAKLAKWLKSQNRRPLLAACDIYRPAAIEQLKVVGEKAGAKVFEMGQTNPVKVSKESVRYAKDNGYDVVILDTAGRLHIDETLMKELVDIEKEVSPNEILLVIDSMLGQDAVNVAHSFNEQLPITGAILTKLDGDTRGGAALSVLSVTGKPIKFAGVGEKLDDIEPFHPERMASRILGMGDMLSLIEKAKISIDQKEQEHLVKKLAEKKFDFNDMLKQYEQLEKMGSLRSVIGMIPGIGNKVKEDQIDDKALPRSKAIICSMTAKERAKPALIDAKRKRRIAAGSGTKVENVNLLLKQMESMQKMVKMMGGGSAGGKNGKMSKKQRLAMQNMSQNFDMGNLGGFGNKMF